MARQHARGEADIDSESTSWPRWKIGETASSRGQQPESKVVH